MTARPLLFHIVKKRLQADPVERLQDWREGLSQTTVSVIEACLLAARDTVSMMKIAAEKDLVAVFGYMDGEHAFSAAIVLVMVCVAFPPTADNMLAMYSALSTLENMARKGNHRIEARHQLPYRFLVPSPYKTHAVRYLYQTEALMVRAERLRSLHLR